MDRKFIRSAHKAEIFPADEKRGDNCIFNVDRDSDFGHLGIAYLSIQRTSSSPVHTKVMG